MKVILEEFDNASFDDEYEVLDADFDEDENFLIQAKNNCLQGRTIAI